MGCKSALQPKKAARKLSLLVSAASWTDVNHKDHKMILIDLINDAVIPYTDPTSFSIGTL